MLLALSPAPLAAETVSDEMALEYRDFFVSKIEEERILGGAFAIVTGGELRLLGVTGHTDTTRQQEINEDTVFRVASVSKTFAAGLAGILVAEGAFNWDDPVTQHVNDFRIKGDSSQVKVRHLLGQSTGLIPHAYDNLIEDGVPIANIRMQFSDLTYICTPGNCYSYQNSIFSMIEPVIQSTTSQTYAEMMQEKVFSPLDMRTASVGYQTFIDNPNHAKPHVRVRDKSWATVRVLPNYYRIPAAAGVNASALDMAKWLMAQMGSHPDVISGDVVQNLIRPRVKTKREIYRRHWNELITDAHYGLGWRVYQLGGETIAYHSGWVSGFRADIAWSPRQQIGIAVLINAESNSINELTTTFWRMVQDQQKLAAENQPATASQSAASPR